MAYVALNALPGVCKVDSQYSNSIKAAYGATGQVMGRYTDMLNCRFIAGRPEKLGGYAPLTSTILSGTCRGIKDFRDFSQNLYCAFGTNTRLYTYNYTGITNITPLRAIYTGNMTNSLTTISSSSTVSVAQTAHGLSTGDYVILTASSAIGGLTIGGVYFVTVTNANAYTFNAGTTATSSVSSGGGQIAFTYYRLTLSNPFTTVASSQIVTVSQTNHGAAVGDTVIISGASAVGGVTLSGSYTIISTTTSTYIINSGVLATSSATGGGSPTVQYEISIGLSDSGTANGYGVGGYGNSGYGTYSSTTYQTLARIWSLDNYGQQLLACPYNGTIYVWDPTIQGRAYPLYNAPTNILTIFVTPERFVFALGVNGNYLNVEWADQLNYTLWPPQAATSTANSRTLQIGSYLVGGAAVRDGTSLVLTNNCCYTFNYTGDQFVYDSTAAGRNSGLIAPHSITTYAGNAYWQGDNEFWMWNGSVTPLPSDDIRDYVFKNINVAQAQKFFAVTNTSKKEITFYYTSASSIEIDSSVTFHVDQQCWSINKKVRTAQIDNQLFTYPISTDASGNIWQEEYGTDANGSALHAYITFNPMAISKGDKIMDLIGFLPDFERQTGALTLEILTQNYPDDPQATAVTETLSDDDNAPLIDLRTGARLIGYTLDSNVVGGDFRVGLCQADVQAAGSRR